MATRMSWRTSWLEAAETGLWPSRVARACLWAGLGRKLGFYARERWILLLLASLCFCGYFTLREAGSAGILKRKFQIDFLMPGRSHWVRPYWREWAEGAFLPLSVCNRPCA